MLIVPGCIVWLLGCFMSTGLWWRSLGKPFVPCGKGIRPPLVQTPYFMPYGKSCRVSGMITMYRDFYKIKVFVLNRKHLLFSVYVIKCNILLSKMQYWSKIDTNLLRFITVMSLKPMFIYPGDISSRMPMSSCVTCWTTSTGSCSAVAMGRLSQSHLRMGSDFPPRRANAACMFM